MGAKLFPGSLYRLHQRFLPVGGAQARELNPNGSRTRLFSAVTVAFVLTVPIPTVAAEAQASRMIVEYVPPTNPAH